MFSWIVARDLVVLAVLALAAREWGRMLLHWLGVRAASRLEEAVMAVGLGFVPFSLALLGLAMAGLATPTGVAAVAGVFVVALIRLRRRSDLVEQEIEGNGDGSRSETLLLSLLTALVLVLALFQAAGPPMAGDSMAYHLPIPARTLETGRLAISTRILPSGYPLAMEMLFMAGLALGSASLAKLFHWLFLCLTLGLLGAFARSTLGPRAALRAVAVLVTVPAVVWVSTWAYADLGATFYLLLSTVALVRHRQGDEAKVGWIVVSALAAGHGLGHKWSLLPYLALNLGPVLLYLLFEGRVRRAHLALWLAVALAVFAPWIAKNLLFFGNPVYPFAMDAFGATSPERLHFHWWQTYHRHRASLSVPAMLRLAFASPEEGLYGNSPIFLPALVALLFLPRKPPWAKALLAFTAVNLAWWGMGLQIFRFLVPLLPFLALAVAYTLGRLEAASPSARRVGLALFWLLLAYATAFLAFGTSLFSNAVAMATVARPADFALRLPYTCPLAQVGDWLRAKAPGEKVLLLWEIRVSYFPSSVEQDDYWTEGGARPGPDLDRNFRHWLDGRLEGGGYGYLLVNWKHRKEWTAWRPLPSEEALAPLLARKRIAPVFRHSSGEFSLFRVLSGRPTPGATDRSGPSPRL